MKKTTKDYFSKDFTGFIIESIGGRVPPEQLDAFLNTLHKKLSKFLYTKNTETNLIRLFSSLYDIAAFINEAITLPHHLEIVSAIVSSSNFLTDIVVQNPGLLYQLFDNDYLLRNITVGSLNSEIKHNISLYKSFNSKLNYLKQQKKRFILKIGLNDILGFDELNQTTSQLSILASSLLSALFDLCRSEIETKYGTGIPSGSYCLASLGKQGGNELNYSSDVDLIIFYEKDFTPQETPNKEYFELLNETVFLFIKSASEITEKGYLYRVDFRLRPDGKNAPLCRTVGDYMHYYESRGENWERQMLIKLGYICGNPLLYNSFYHYLRGFIFPSTHFQSIKEQINKIKKDIERRIEGAENVKLFPGGIRDIEFSVQALQLLNGSKIKELRNGNTLESIELLHKNGLLSNPEANTLKKAYIFYRRTEHFLQLMNDRQTHLIPAEEEMLNKLAVYLNLRDKKDFKKKLAIHREKVRKIFLRIVKADTGAAVYDFSKIVFTDNNRAGKNLRFLRKGAGLINDKVFEVNTIENFELIENDIVKYLRKSAAPDKTLDNFTKVIKTSRVPSLWYNQFRNEYFLKAFLALCERSQKSIDIITSSGQAEDCFISGNCFFIPPQDTIGNMNFSELILTASVLYTLKKIKEKDFSRLLSDGIDSRIKKLTGGFSFNYFIAALGSYGAREMNFASDIDFLIVIEDENDIPAAEIEFNKLIKLLGKEIGLFEIDLRLRPEGKSSQLVRTLMSYKNYFSQRARIWEFQSLSKLRFITGSDILFKSFANIIFERAATINSRQLREEIAGMHKALIKPNILQEDNSVELKKAKGGFVTIEFAIQFLLLSDITAYKKSLGKTVAENLKYLAGHSGLGIEMKALASNYSILKKLLMYNQNYHNGKNYKFVIEITDLPAGGIKTAERGTNMLNDLNITMKQNFEIFNKILEN